MTSDGWRDTAETRPISVLPETGNWLMQGFENSENLPVYVCLPHAGCGASAFANTARQFLQNTQNCIYRYPARETRLAEPPAVDLKNLASRILDELPPQLDQRPMAVFGHSMGARIGYEIAHQMLMRGNRPLRKLVVSSSPAPNLARPIDQSYRGSREDFVSYLHRLGGMPAELLEVEELVDLLLPALRADFAMLDAYEPTAPLPSLSCPIDVFYSPEDRSTTFKEVEGWADISSGKVTFHKLTGGHFYFSSQKQTLTQILTGGADTTRGE